MKATRPSPANAATDVSVNADLSWVAGIDANSHNVYFGTSNPPAFKVNQTASTYNPGTLHITIQHIIGALMKSTQSAV